MKPIAARPCFLERLARLLMLLAAAALLGCFETEEPTRVAGGDDIPNDVEPLGKKAARERDDSTDWNGYQSMPRTSPGMYDTITVPDTVPDTSGSGQAQPAPRGQGMAKQGAASALSGGADRWSAAALPPLDPLLPLDTLVTRVVDTAKGAVETVHIVVKDSILRVDSTVFVPVDPAKPGSPQGILRVSGKITYADTARWRAYRCFDADGDGFLTPRAGSANLADLIVEVKDAAGVVTRTVQRIAAGADLDFNGRADNRLLQNVVLATLGSDTLDLFKLSDADGDSSILDFTKDTNLVDLIEEHRYPGSIGPASMTQQARLVVFSGDSTRNYAIRFQRRTAYRDGSALEVTTRGGAADSSFRAGGEAVWTETLTPSAGDSVASHARAFTVRLAAAPGAFAGNTLAAIAVTEVYRGTPEASFTFGFRSESPVAHGRWPAAGAVEAELRHRQGSATAFAGQAVSAGMEGVITTSAGDTIGIFFDRNGKATRRP
jgi:hypothetical protein